MKIFKSKHKLQKEILNIKNISFVPTMGGLHKGHISLIKKSQNFKGKTLVSIFVNPKQFNEKKDFLNYPRNLKKDLKILKHLNVDLIYLPNLKDIFSFQVKNKIFLDKFYKKLCGRSRKGHFKGVLNIVNGGVHANNNLDIQEFMICPNKVKSFSEAIRTSFLVIQSLKEIMQLNAGDQFLVFYNQTMLTLMLYFLYQVLIFLKKAYVS